MDLAVQPAIDRSGLAVHVDHFAGAALDRRAANVRRLPGKAIADEVVRVVLVLLDVVPQPAFDLRAARIEQPGPRIGSAP